jgi:SAM-dependent methyltransferase
MNQYGAGDDIYRFTPDGLRNVLSTAGFEVEALEGPERLFGLLAEVPAIALRKRGMNKPADGSRAVGRGLDRIFRMRRDGRGLTLSRAYIATARKIEEPHGHIASPRTRRKQRGELTLRERSTIDTIPSGRGRAVELEGNAGPQDALRALGYSVVPGATSPGTDPDPLQVEDGSLSLVLASDGLGRFPDPLRAITEIRRVLADDGTFVGWMPHLHPWTGGEYLRFTPVGIAVLLRWAGFKVTHFDAPLRLMSVLGQVTIHGLRMTEGGGAARVVERVAYGADRVTKRFLGLGYAYAAGFRVVARPAPIPSDRSLMNAAGAPLSQLWTDLGDEEMTRAVKKAGR